MAAETALRSQKKLRMPAPAMILRKLQCGFSNTRNNRPFKWWASRLAGTSCSICPPIDLAYSSLKITEKHLGFYDYQFIRTLKKGITERRHFHPDCPSTELSPFPKTLFDFDNRFTAPLNGFIDAADYYQQSSSKRGLNQITVPTTVLIANDDPVVPAEIFDDACFSDSTTLIRTEYGGHMGYLARKGKRWMDDQIIHWLSIESEH